MSIFSNTEINELIKGFSGLNKATPSLTTGGGLNFLPLEEEARNTYPVFHPVLDAIPRVTPEELGHEVGGLQVTWKQVLNPGTNVLPSLPEGSRGTPINIPTLTTSANFVTLGVDASVTFESQSAGVGFNDNLGTVNLAKLNVLLNLEERMAIFGNPGNSGSGNNGFQLGTPAAPVIALANGGSFGSAVSVTVTVVALTGWGVYNQQNFGAFLTRPGIAQQVTTTSAEGNTVVNNGGTSIASAASNTVVTSSGQQTVTVTVTPVVGALGYAAFVSTNGTPTAANSFFAGVYTTSVFTISAAASGSNQRVSDLTATDFSANPAVTNSTGDFAGIATWLFNSQTANSGARPAYVKDLAGAGLTADGAGGIVEFETALSSQWNQYQVTPDAIWVSNDLMQFVNQKIQTSPSGSGAASTVFVRNGGPNGEVIGGSMVQEYKSKFSAYNEQKVLPIRNIPYLPANTIMMPTLNNPYPAAGDTIPSNYRIVCREGYYGLKFPYRTRQHEVGIYVEEAMEAYVPWAGVLLTSVGDK